MFLKRDIYFAVISLFIASAMYAGSTELPLDGTVTKCSSENGKQEQTLTNREVEDREIMQHPVMRLALVGQLWGKEGQLKLLDEVLLPDAKKEKDAHCPSFFKRITSQQTDEEKASCEQAKKQVICFEMAQKALIREIKFDSEYARCGADKACQERAIAEFEKFSAKLKLEALNKGIVGGSN